MHVIFVLKTHELNLAYGTSRKFKDKNPSKMQIDLKNKLAITFQNCQF